MPILKYYNQSTLQWEPVIVGKQGPQGIQGIQGETGSGPVNAVINGAFDFWQRGTSFSSGSSAFTYTADRWGLVNGGAPTGSYSVSQQTFPTGSAPVAGYEGRFFLRYAVTTPSGTAFQGMVHKIEDVRTFAGQTVTLSFFAKADAARTITPSLGQEFGIGGSSFNTNMGTPINITTSWARYTQTFNIASLAGKTITSNSNLEIFLNISNAVQTVDIWGVQLEAGSTATPFRRAANTLQGELAACQRYYFRYGGDAGNQYFASGSAVSGSSTRFIVNLPVTMRANPSSVDFGTLAVYDVGGASIIAVTTLTIADPGRNITSVTANVASGLTLHRPLMLIANGSLNSFLAFNAEL